MDIEAINSMRPCSNARPPISNKVKGEQSKEIDSQIAEFLSNGGEIDKLEGVGVKAQSKTYKEVNDSYYVG